MNATTPIPAAQIKDSRNYHFHRVVKKSDNVMLFAIVSAVLVHTGLIFGISFADSDSPTAVAQEVTSVLTDNMQKNEKADFIANASQEGGGEAEEKKPLQSANTSPIEAEEVKPTDDIVAQERKTRQERYEENYLRTTLSWEKIDDKKDNKKDDDSQELEAQEQRLQQQIATLETKIGTQEQLIAKKASVKIISSNSTTQSEEASYIENLLQQVYHVGNQNYPQEARANGLKGDVILMVVIDPSGKIKAINLRQSSGYPVLDEAAKDSVRKAAPFGKFDKGMENISELRIIRTWRFDDNLSVDYE